MMYHNGRELRQKKVSREEARKTTKSLLWSMNDGSYHETCTLLPSAMQGCTDETTIDITNESKPQSQEMLHCIH